MKVWDKLDEVLLGVIGAVILGSVAALAIVQGYDGGTAQICITGVVAIITAALGLKGRTGGEKSGPVSA